jgi:Calcineurin-like phosphoesterase.
VSTPLVLRLPPNTEGRDFVVGDIHGCFDLVLEAMSRARFDRRVDRIISVGDLIDRGPGSERCLRFLAQPWVHAVRGNHEDMVLEIYADGEPDPAVLQFMASRNGFAWWLDTEPEARREMVAAFARMPVAIEIPTPRGLVGVVHADVPHGMSWQHFTAAVEAGDKKVTETALWGRDRLHRNDDSGVPGVGRVFVGHTPLRRLTRLGNIYAIDTGGVYGVLDVEHAGALSFADVLTHTGTLTTLNPIGKVAVVYPDTAPSHPFSGIGR